MHPFVANWNREHELYFEKQNKLEESVARAKNRLEKHQRLYPTWIEGIVKPLAMELAELRGMQYELYGPFGLRAATSIYLTPKGSDGNIVKNDTWSITITIGKPNDKWEAYYDTGKCDSFYPQNSIGKLNGFDKEIALLPDTIEEINALLRFSPGIKED